jgi:hypothetical protein
VNISMVSSLVVLTGLNSNSLGANLVPKEAHLPQYTDRFIISVSFVSPAIAGPRWVV